MHSVSLHQYFPIKNHLPSRLPAPLVVAAPFVVSDLIMVAEPVVVAEPFVVAEPVEATIINSLICEFTYSPRIPHPATRIPHPRTPHHKKKTSSSLIFLLNSFIKYHHLLICMRIHLFTHSPQNPKPASRTSHLSPHLRAFFSLSSSRSLIK